MLVLVLALLPGVAHAQQVCNNTYTVTEATSGGTRQTDDHFGAVLTSGNYNGDGETDLVIGMPDEDADGVFNAGQIIAQYGRSTGLGIIEHDTFTQNDVFGSTSQSGDKFGAVLATGDFNDDGYDDVAVAAPGEDEGAVVDTGRVWIVYGSSMGLDGSVVSSFTQEDVVGDGDSDGDFFGAALAVGDFDGDGYDDLAIGIPGEDVSTQLGAGRVVIVYGSVLGLSVGTSEGFNQTHFGASTAENGDAFGEGLAAGDFDGDGYDDLAVGAPGEDRNSLSNVGRVHIKFADDTGLGLKAGTNWDQIEAADFGAVDKDNDEQGEVLATADITGDGYDDLILGVPSKEIDAKNDVGLVAVFMGGTDIVSNGRHLDATDAGQSNVGGDQFGEAVHVADLNGDTYGDLVVGVPDYGSNSGAIAVFWYDEPADSFTIDTPRWFEEDCLGGTVANDARFGFDITSGDFDGLGGIELAAGDPYHTANEYGVVFVGEIF
jgi:hypothetical protein